jgi:Rrf2 family protein
LRVATSTEEEPISAQTIADLEGMSVPHTQKILRILTQGGLVDSKRGVHGGYFAARPAEEVSLGDVMRALGGFLEVEELCGRHTGELEVCRNACDCTIRPIWSHISDYVMRTMDRIPLSVLTEDEGAVRAHLAGLQQFANSAAPFAN